MKKKIEKGSLCRCPYCGRVINFFFLYDSKHYDFGHCSHCGGIYAVRYSSWPALLSAGALLATAIGILVHLMMNGKMPPWTFYLVMAAVMMVIYLLIPLFIQPTKCVVDGNLGGFPNKESMPQVLQQKIMETGENDPSENNHDSLSEKAKEMFVGFSPNDYVFSNQNEEEDMAARRAYEEDRPHVADEPTIVASQVNIDQQLSAQERYQRVQKNRSGARHSK